MLKRMMQNVLKGRGSEEAVAAISHEGPSVLNVGGASKQIAISQRYDTWESRSARHLG